MNQPEDRLNVLAGTDVTFSVSLDRGVLETDMFRWLFRGAPIADSTAGYTGLGTPDLTVVGVDSDDEGPYSVIITGEAFFLFSNGGILSICKCIVIFTTYIIIILYAWLVACYNTRKSCFCYLICM